MEEGKRRKKKEMRIKSHIMREPLACQNERKTRRRREKEKREKRGKETKKVSRTSFGLESKKKRKRNKIAGGGKRE